MKLTIGTRGSQLALWQTHHVRGRLQQQNASLDIDIEILRTTGDRITDVPLASIGDRGLFTRELDRAVLDGTADFAVHSLKDIPTVLPEGLALAAVLEREDPRDAFLAAPGRPQSLADLAPGATVGTSSLRRRALLLHLRPDLRVEDMRGNLDTRIDRLHAGACDAAILALAGIRRLGRTDVVGEILSPPVWLPAVGQGAIAIICRSEDVPTRQALQALDHSDTRTAVLAERAFLRALEGGCQIPIGGLARCTGDRVELAGFVAGYESGRMLQHRIEGKAADPVAVGVALADHLRGLGADELLREVRGASGSDLPAASAP
ncbi:MAG TPA: hydroxymethylbilane synthase [Longimicrobiales bacterium]|nr:hydroxymethylbilane synthase [Longimicrobiales bacterium]